MNTVTTPAPIDALAQALIGIDPLSLSKPMQAIHAQLVAETACAKTLGQAAIALFRLKNRLDHPAGEFDSHGRFYLSEKYPCCCGLRQPSAAYPFSQMVHGRSAGHVAVEWCVKELDLKRALSLVEAFSALRTLATAK